MDDNWGLHHIYKTVDTVGSSSLVTSQDVSRIPSPVDDTGATQLRSSATEAGLEDWRSLDSTGPKWLPFFLHLKLVVD